jgi:hypothetical protein
MMTTYLLGAGRLGSPGIAVTFSTTKGRPTTETIATDGNCRATSTLVSAEPARVMVRARVAAIVPV